MSLAVVRDLRVARAPVTPDELAALETDVLAGFVLARAAAGLADSHHRLGRRASGADPGLVRASIVGDGAG